MQTIHEGRIYYIKKLLTPKTLKTCDSNTLLLSMKVRVRSSKIYIKCKGGGRVRLSTSQNDTEDSKEISLGR